ncbi:hypothetical protein [Euzebya sp.]|uniref:hypothetical protein n=1 Tax=Euzebya sp. TaxID=1971409 RepID=UPI003513ECCF
MSILWLFAVALGLIVEYLLIRGAVKDALGRALYDNREFLLSLLREANTLDGEPGASDRE